MSPQVRVLSCNVSRTVPQVSCLCLGTWWHAFRFRKSVMTLTFVDPFFSLGNIGVHTFVLWVSSRVNILKVAVSKYSPIVSIKSVSVGGFLVFSGFGAQCIGAFTPCRIAVRSTLSAPIFSQLLMLLLGPMYGQRGAWSRFLPIACFRRFSLPMGDNPLSTGAFPKHRGGLPCAWAPSLGLLFVALAFSFSSLSTC